MRGFVRARSRPDCKSDATRLFRESRESSFNAATQSPRVTHGALSARLRLGRCLMERVQRLRFFGLALLAWCQPYVEYVPVTSATYSIPTTHAPAISDYDASGELPSTAERYDESARTPAVMLPFFPFFPFPQIDIGRGYDPNRPRSPAYGPGGGPR